MLISAASAIADLSAQFFVCFLRRQEINKKLEPYKHKNLTLSVLHFICETAKNPVYLLTLQHSRHPNYMFDDTNDHDDYEAFIHAVYKKYNINHDSKLAAKGELLLESCLGSRAK